MSCGMSQRELAQLIGVDQSAVARWETDKNGARIANLKRVAAVLNCSVSDLLDDDPTKCETGG